MAEMETKVREAAENLAREIIATLRGMTLGELAGLVRTPGGRAKRRASVAKPRTPVAPKVALARKNAPTKKAASMKAGTVITRSDGRKFTKTPKVVAARRAQGQYLGHLRQVPEKEKARIRVIVKEKGVPAAVVEMKKMLAKAKRSGKTAPAARAVAPVARPKKKALPASYYRCAHPGCTKNWYVKGRPYCGEHAKLPAKTKNKK